MSTSFSFMIHNENLVRLADLYITMKGNIITQDRLNKLKFNTSDENYLTNPTLTATRDLIILKLTGDLRNMYLDVYDEENSDSSTLDMTTYTEWNYLSRRAVELDLVDFFARYSYNSFYIDENSHPEEIQADIDSANEYYSEFIKGEYFKEQLLELVRKRNKNGYN